LIEKTKNIFVIMKVIFASLCHFLTAQKVTKKAPWHPWFPDPPSIRPGLLQGRRHPWPFDWLPSLGFRCRPLFFIHEKKRHRRYP
jgi:hypothetical protein